MTICEKDHKVDIVLDDPHIQLSTDRIYINITAWYDYQMVIMQNFE